MYLNTTNYLNICAYVQLLACDISYVNVVLFLLYCVAQINMGGYSCGELYNIWNIYGD